MNQDNLLFFIHCKFLKHFRSGTEKCGRLSLIVYGPTNFGPILFKVQLHVQLPILHKEESLVISISSFSRQLISFTKTIGNKKVNMVSVLYIEVVVKVNMVLCYKKELDIERLICIVVLKKHLSLE